MAGIEELIAKIQKYNSEADFELIKRAYEFAAIAHAGQERASGEPVISHPLAVAHILADYHLDVVTIAVGLLHDTIEDSAVSPEELQKEFGSEVVMIVEGETKIGGIKLRNFHEEKYVENLRKMILAMAKDLRVVLVKLADRLHNMQTLQYLPAEKQKRIAKETLEVYAPLADRLGMGHLKGELEDLAFSYVYPEDYIWLAAYAKPYFEDAEEFWQKAERVIYRHLADEGIRAKISSRQKHLYSLWRKLLRSDVNKDITKVYDLVAMRVLVDSVKDCYTALGVVHAIWKPVPWIGIRDFIAQPKPNGYRSIHTNVFSQHERILEIQIRTFEMHEQAENGIAAHWFYASFKSQGTPDQKLKKGEVFAPIEKISWVKQLVSWQKEIVDTKEYLEALKFDALAQRIFVFSPKGDVYDLPVGATPIDFAYAVHTDLGNQADGALVNGKMVGLSHKLSSGDVVQIIEKEGTGPSEKWLRFVVTSEAKRKILKHARHAV